MIFNQQSISFSTQEKINTTFISDDQELKTIVEGF